MKDLLKGEILEKIKGAKNQEQVAEEIAEFIESLFIVGYHNETRFLNQIISTQTAEAVGIDKSKILNQGEVAMFLYPNCDSTIEASNRYIQARLRGDKAHFKNDSRSTISPEVERNLTSESLRAVGYDFKILRSTIAILNGKIIKPADSRTS